MKEEQLINLLEKAWNQGWMHRERFDDIEHPEGMDYEEINFHHFKKWFNQNKQLLLHNVSNCTLCNTEINYKGVCEMCYTEQKLNDLD